MSEPVRTVAPARRSLLRSARCHSINPVRDGKVGSANRLRGRMPAVARLIGFGFLIALVSGCVARRMTIRSNVDHLGGALVTIDKREVGISPVSTGFTYYAPREIQLIKDGYETQTFIQDIPAPWWDNLLTEFFVENLWPFTVRDEHDFMFTLTPKRDVSGQKLLERGQILREDALSHSEAVPLAGSEKRKPLF